MYKSIELPDNYIPSADEPYMNPQQLEFFRRKLHIWREELVEEQQLTSKVKVEEEEWRAADTLDQASMESESMVELRSAERCSKLIKKIDEALERIEDGSYGYCEETGVEIGIGRLIARPIATLSIEAKERQERLEKLYNTGN